MNWWVVALSMVAAMGLVSVVLMVVDRVRSARAYRAKVGLDVAGLAALLPPDLRDRNYSDFMIALRRDPERISVGLLYADGSVQRRGNPPNVGLEFDAKSGSLLAVHPGGIGLGIK